MDELEKLQKKVKKMIENSTDEEFKQMVFYWYGEELLAEELRRSIDSCEDIDCVKGFFDIFKKDKRSKV